MSELKPIEINGSNFHEAVLTATKPVVIYFWHQFCGPCKSVSPKIEQIAAVYGDRVNICKSNIRDWQGGADHFGIRGVPAVLFLSGGELKNRIHGGTEPLEQIKLMVDDLIRSSTGAVVAGATSAQVEFEAALAAANAALEASQAAAYKAYRLPLEAEANLVEAAYKPMRDEIERRTSEAKEKLARGEVTQDEYDNAYVQAMIAVEDEESFKDAVATWREADAKYGELCAPHMATLEQKLAQAETEYNSAVIAAKAKLAAATSTSA